jgi:hypothetical protein
MRVDIAVTWPRSRELQSYLDELARAERDGEWINFRVPFAPKRDPERCYMVHDGFMRGWTAVKTVVRRGDREVRDPSGGWWPAGWYIVRDPEWHPLAEPVEMRGFRGFKWIERPEEAQ